MTRRVEEMIGTWGWEGRKEEAGNSFYGSWRDEPPTHSLCCLSIHSLVLHSNVEL
jgi:hypothetical protein